MKKQSNIPYKILLYLIGMYSICMIILFLLKTGNVLSTRSEDYSNFATILSSSFSLITIYLLVTNNARQSNQLNDQIKEQKKFNEESKKQFQFQFAEEKNANISKHINSKLDREQQRRFNQLQYTREKLDKFDDVFEMILTSDMPAIYMDDFINKNVGKLDSFLQLLKNDGLCSNEDYEQLLAGKSHSKNSFSLSTLLTSLALSNTYFNCETDNELYLPKEIRIEIRKAFYTVNNACFYINNLAELGSSCYEISSYLNSYAFFIRFLAVGNYSEVRGGSSYASDPITKNEIRGVNFFISEHSRISVLQERMSPNIIGCSEQKYIIYQYLKNSNSLSNDLLFNDFLLIYNFTQNPIVSDNLLVYFTVTGENTKYTLTYNRDNGEIKIITIK